MSEFYDSYETTQSIDVTPPKGLVEGASGPCSSLDTLICTLNEAKGLRITLPEGTDPAEAEAKLHRYLSRLELSDDVTSIGFVGVFNDSQKVTDSVAGPVVHLTKDGTATPIPVSLYVRLLDGILGDEELEDMFPLKHVDLRKLKEELLGGVEDKYLQDLGWGMIIKNVFDGNYKENGDELSIFDQEGELFIQVQLDRTASAQIEKTVEGFEALPVYSQTSLTVLTGILCIGLPVALSFVAKSAFDQIFAVKLFERAMQRGEELKKVMDEADNIARRQETILSRLLAKFGLSGNDNSVRTAAVSPTHTLDEEYHRAQLARLTLGTQYGIPHTMQETPKPTLIWVKREKPEKQKRTFRARRRGGRYFIKGQLTGLYESYLKVKNNPDAYPPDSRLRKIHDYVEENFDVD